MKTERLSVVSGIVMSLALIFVSVSQGQEWTRFRGSNGQGISHARNIPVKWTDDDYNWKVKLPAGGHSSPVLWGDKVFVTCGDQGTGRGVLLALRTSDGKPLWRQEYAMSSYRPNKLNSYATAR